MANQLQVLREGIVISTFDIDEGTIFSEKLQGARTITCPVAAEEDLPLEEGDYINHNGEVYIINTLPDFTKDGGKLQKDYNITFEAEFYLLLDTFILNDQSHAVFPKYGSAVDHLNMIFANANRNDTGWTVGEVAATGGELINYNWTYVRTALDEIAATFKLEWSFTGRTIRMVSQVGVDTGLTFEVGRGKGLHQISRTQDSGKSVVTRVFGVGGSTNLDYTYRGGVEPNLIFDGRYVETPGVTSGTERVREGRYENDQIYPRFNGNVTGVVVNRNAQNLITSVVITDTAIDFDINAHLQEGVTAKVSFRTGALTGSDFEIVSYNAGTKAIELIPVADTNGYVLPNDLNLPLVGDKFTLLDIRMPAAYVTAAELELRNAALQYLNDNNMSRLLFGVKPDQKHLRDNNIVLKVGDRATVIETEIDVNEILRFTEISYPLVNTFDVTAAIGNEIAYNRVVKLFAEVLQTQRDVQTVDRRSAELAKRGVKDLRAFEASVFDTDGMFDSDKFNVGVLTAILGIFGAKSQNFKLNGVYITDNYGANPAQVAISGGELIHFEIENDPGGNIWVMTGGTYNVPTTSALYYVYARCSEASQVGSWVVTTAQIKADDEAGFYHFLTGVVYPVIDGWRNSDFTNGIADINGNRLKIGKIISRDGLTGFDLDASTIFGAITFASGSSGYNNIADKPDLSVYATQDFVDAIKDELQGQIDGSITTWFYPYVPTLANVPASGWTTDEEKNAQLGDLFYDTATGYAYRFQVVGGVYSWEQISDTDITLALQKAQEAQDTADGKRRVFTVTPYTPYDVGDLWSQGTGGDLMRCNVARASGAYVAADWGKASKYTDDTAVNNLVIGGRNLWLKQQSFGVYNLSFAIYGDESLGRLGSKPIFLQGNGGLGNIYFVDFLSTFNLIDGESVTISFWARHFGTIGTPTIYLEDGSFYASFSPVESDVGGSWSYHNFTFSARASVLSIAISGYGQLFLSDIKLEKGNKATDWTPAPEDVQAEADAAAAEAEAAAKAYADAQDNLNEITIKAYADGIVDAEEARAIADATAKLAEAKADATAKSDAARIAAEAAAAALVGGIKVGGGNLLQNTYNFTNLNNWSDLGTGLNIAGTFLDGTPVIRTGQSGARYTTDFAVKGNTEYILSTWVFSEVTFDGGGSTQPLHIYIGSTPGGTDLGYDVIAYDQNYPTANVWKKIYLIIKTRGATGQTVYMRYHNYPNGFGGTYWYWTKMYVAEGNTVQDWQPSGLDASTDATAKANAAQAAAIAQAAATAETIAQSKADIAQAAAISAAATDATNKANAAKAAAEAASNAFAQTAANNAASDAEIAAAADASNKATAAYNDAVTAAAQAQANLTASLGALAYENVVELSKLGNTVIQGGMIVTNLLNADYIKANIVNADYITALDIVAKTLAADSGTIGGWNIGATTLFSGTDPGNYIELQSGSSPRLYMRNSAQVDGEYSLMNSSGIAIISNGNALPTSYGSYNAVAAFKLKNGASFSDIALYCSAPEGVSYAFMCDGGSLFTKTVAMAMALQVNGLASLNNGVRIGGIGGPTGDRPLRVNAAGEVYRGS